MTGAIPALSHRLRPVLAALCLGAAGVLLSAPAQGVLAKYGFGKPRSAD